MKKRVLSLLLCMALCLSLLPTAALAEGSDDHLIEFNYSGPCDQVNTKTFDIGEKLPSDAQITSVQVSMPAILSSCTPEWTTNQAKVSIATRIFDEPTSGTFTAKVITSNCGEYTVKVNITLTGKYIVTISGVTAQDALHDGKPHTGYSGTPVGTLTNGSAYTGDYVYTYAKQDGTALGGAPSEVGEYTVTIAVPDSNKDYKGSTTLNFKIVSAAEAAYQTQEEGRWLCGAFTQALADVYEGGTVKLLTNVDLGSTATAAKAMTITSNDAASPRMLTSTTDAHGYLLRINGDVTITNVIVDGGSQSSITASRALIAVGDGTNSGKLTLGDGAIIRNNNNSTQNGAGGGICVITGHLTIDGAQIINNCAYSGGGVAVVGEGAAATLKSGSIKSNTSTSSTEKGGGGVYISAGSFAMDGGEVRSNKAEYQGGGIYMSGSVTMSAGKIAENQAGKVGGAIYVGSGALTLTGGVVSGNSATNFAGGIECPPGSYGTIYVSGSPVITGNISGEEKDGGLYPDGHSSIGYADIKLGLLDPGADINFYTWAQADGFVIASPADNYTITAADVSRMSYINDSTHSFSLKLNGDGNVVLTTDTVHFVSFDANGGSVETAVAQVVDGIFSPALTELPTPTRSGRYRFDGWFTEKNGGEKVTTDTVFSSDTTIYAHWTYTGSSGGSYTPTYPITVDDAESGSAAADYKSAAKGTTVTITPKPTTGYQVSEVKVLDKDGNPVEVKKNADGTYSFIQPASKVTVQVTYSPVDAGFTDVPADAYYADAVNWAAAEGITGGIGSNLFAPDLACTRAQIVTFLWRAAGSPAPKTVRAFSDVPADAYYAQAVYWAAENGITGGVGDNKFAPDLPCTRAQAVAFLFRANADVVTLQELVSGYEDAEQVPGYALSAFNWALANGVMQGYNNELMPNEDCTRAQIVTFLYRAAK